MNPVTESICALCLLLFTCALDASAQPCEKLKNSGSLPNEIRIADDRGDHGAPNPFRHYPRGSGYVRMSWVFDTLVWKDRNGSFVPSLAASWSYEEKEGTWIFNLDEKARWHDGRPVTADDVAFSFAYYEKHPYPWADTSVVEKVEVLSPHSVQLYPRRPYAPFLAEIGGTLPIIPKHIWQDIDDPRRFNAPEAFIGSGPYQFRDFNKVRGTYLFEAFADYHLGAPRVQRLIYLRSANPLAALATRQADLAAIRPEMIEPLKREGMCIIEDERGWVRKLMINHRRFPFSERSFRQALAHAIDRDKLIAKSQRGHAEAASFGLLSADHPFYNPDTPHYRHDPARALELLTELGFTRNDGGVLERDGKPLRVQLLSTRMTVAGGTGGERDGLILKQQLQAIGMEVDLLTLEQTTADQKISGFDFDLALSGHGGIAGDPRILNEMILPGRGGSNFNNARFEDSPLLTDLLQKQLAEMNPGRRHELVAQAQEIIARELPAIPLYHPRGLSAYRSESGIEWFYTPGGLGKGVPIAQNKRALLP
ncbi:ABC transporter substrate-binding protein [Geoalkalibacter subterraneus]|uniref:ABC transporter substrate-binding protein n=1 Tax=Geoalkalibacter subterraneus TaxID=483547 RepID=UPI000693DA1A|nr:ABC transporter substrate-binding protein [Geoalkalibacter subterraneus]